MNPLLKKSYPVSESVCDEQGNCTLPYLLHCMEDAAFADCDRIGQGTDLLRDKYGLTWMLFGSKLTVSSLPKRGSSFTVQTQFCGVHGVSAFRSYDILCNGTSVAHCEQIWVVVRLDTRMLVNPQKIPELMIEGFPVPPQRRRPTIRCNDLSLQCAGTGTVQSEDLDFNGHMNNVRYVERALSFLPEGSLSAPYFLQLAYQYEMLEGQSFDCLCAEDGGKQTVVFRSHGRNCFLLQVTKAD